MAASGDGLNGAEGHLWVWMESWGALRQAPSEVRSSLRDAADSETAV